MQPLSILEVGSLIFGTAAQAMTIITAVSRLSAVGTGAPPIPPPQSMADIFAVPQKAMADLMALPSTLMQPITDANQTVANMVIPKASGRPN